MEQREVHNPASYISIELQISSLLPSFLRIPPFVRIRAQRRQRSPLLDTRPPLRKASKSLSLFPYNNEAEDGIATLAAVGRRRRSVSTAAPDSSNSGRNGLRCRL